MKKKKLFSGVLTTTVVRVPGVHLTFMKELPESQQTHTHIKQSTGDEKKSLKCFIIAYKNVQLSQTNVKLLYLLHFGTLNHSVVRFS